MKGSIVLLLVLSVGRVMWSQADAPCARPGSAVLMLAVTEGDLETVRHCLRHGAPPADETGVSLLGLAAWHGQPHVMRALMEEYGFDVNAASPAGWTPLMMAVLGGHAEAVEMLLRAGAEVDAKTEVGTTAVSVAIDRGYEDLAERLLDAGRGSNDWYEEDSLSWLRCGGRALGDASAEADPPAGWGAWASR